MSHDDLQRAAHEHLLLHFSRNGAFGPDGAELLVLERGEGPYVFDTRGRRYIDALSSLFCCQIGYSYGEEMMSAAAGQLTKLAFNTVWGTAHPAAIELAERMADLAPGDLNKVFFTNGGSESVESAWKIAREHHIANGEPQRTKAIARKVAYHGVTLGALSFTGVPGMKDGFGTPPVDVRHVSNTNRYRVPDGDDEAAFCARLLAEIEFVIEEEGPDTIALIIAEPIQNAGGCLLPPDGYWRGLREICDRHGILLMADEVITGCGRIGEWFAVAREGVAPDLVSLAKGLTSAYAPMGAVVVGDRVAAPLYERKRLLRHGITFAGHPLSAAIALKNIEIFERDGVLDNVHALEGHLRERMEGLRALPIVGDIRGAGFFWAAELVRTQPASRAGTSDGRFDADERERLVRGYLPKRLLEAGLIARPDDRGDPVVQVAPPLTADAEVLDAMVDALGEVLADAGAHMGVGSAAAAAH